MGSGSGDLFCQRGIAAPEPAQHEEVPCNGGRRGERAADRSESPPRELPGGQSGAENPYQFIGCQGGYPDP